MEGIPVIDFADYGLNVTDPSSIDDVTLAGLASEMRSAFEEYGFLYLRNHGIPDATIQNIFGISTKFFQMPEQEKMKCRMTTENNNGWIPADGESVNPEDPGDLKETINYDPVGNFNKLGWPTSELPSFLGDFDNCFTQCHALAIRILELIALGLGKERDYFTKLHKKMATKGNRSLLRSNYYPPVLTDHEMKPGQLRLGEHSDIGSITLLFNDDNGGLEAFKPEVGFVPVHPINGTVIVKLGDAMQRMTAGRFTAVKHRVAMPSSPESRQRARQSVVLFVNADDDAMLSCMDGSQKYPDISMGDYLSYMVKRNFHETN